jgi:hypothetical protein
VCKRTVANQGALGGLGIDCKISGPDRIVCFPPLVLLSTKTLLSKIQKTMNAVTDMRVWFG